jgi:hypothetical protein
MTNIRGGCRGRDCMVVGFEGKNILLLLYMNISLFFTYMLFVNFEGKKLHIDLETQECQSEQEISPDITR